MASACLFTSSNVRHHRARIWHSETQLEKQLINRGFVGGSGDVSFSEKMANVDVDCCRLAAITILKSTYFFN